MTQQFILTDSAGNTYTALGAFDVTGTIFNSVVDLKPGAVVAITHQPGVPVTTSPVTANGQAANMLGPNPNRKQVTFQVPNTAQNGLWVNWGGVASVNGTGCFYFTPGTTVNFPVDVVGLGAISMFSQAAGVPIPVSES